MLLTLEADGSGPGENDAPTNSPLHETRKRGASSREKRTLISTKNGQEPMIKALPSILDTKMDLKTYFGHFHLKNNTEFGKRCKGDVQTKMYVTRKEADLSLNLLQTLCTLTDVVTSAIFTVFM